MGYLAKTRKKNRKYLSNTNDVAIINYVIGLEYGKTTEFVRMIALEGIFYNIKMKMKNLSNEVMLQNRQGMYIFRSSKCILRLWDQTLGCKYVFKMCH